MRRGPPSNARRRAGILAFVAVSACVSRGVFWALYALWFVSDHDLGRNRFVLRSVVVQEQIWQTPEADGGGLSVAQRRLLATGRTTIVKSEPGKLKRMAEEVIDLT